MKIRLLLQLCCVSIIMMGCTPGQLVGPTLTPVSTITPTDSPTPTHTITLASTLAPTSTEIPTTTPTITPTTAELPCKGIPIMDGAEYIKINTDACSYSIKTSIPDVVEYYLQEIPILGYQLVDTVKASGDGKILLFEKEDGGIAINIFADFLHPGYVLVIIPLPTEGDVPVTSITFSDLFVVI